MNPDKSSLASYYSELDQENTDRVNSDISVENEMDPTLEAFQRLSHAAGVDMPPQVLYHLYTLVKNDVFADDIYITLRRMYDASRND